MASILLSSQNLYEPRKQIIRRSIAPLLPQPPGVRVGQVGPGLNDFTLGVLPSNRPSGPVLNPEEVLVATKAPGVLFNYFETWKDTKTTENYYLDRSYMHVHLRKRGMRPQQVLSLHCDPALRQSEEHFAYKRGPHLHIHGAAPSVDRAHVSLCLHDALHGGSNIDQLTANIAEAIWMIVREFFPCWERAARE